YSSTDHRNLRSFPTRRSSDLLGINVERVFSVTFALGSALAGLGGALGIDVLGLDPTFPLKYMVYFLLVVAVGGAGTIRGPLIAADRKSTRLNSSHVKISYAVF